MRSTCRKLKMFDFLQNTLLLSPSQNDDLINFQDIRTKIKAILLCVISELGSSGAIAIDFHNGHHTAHSRRPHE
jgi:hypothetical protein